MLMVGGSTLPHKHSAGDFVPLECYVFHRVGEFGNKVIGSNECLSSGK